MILKMGNPLVNTILSDSHSERNRSIESLLEGCGNRELLDIALELEAFRKSSANLYHKVRASLFLFFIYRFRLLNDGSMPSRGDTPIEGIMAAYDRDFEKAIDIYSGLIKKKQTHLNLLSAAADAYHKSAFKYLFDQVKLSISQCRENFLLFDIRELNDYPHSVPEALTTKDTATGLYPVGIDVSPVRLDPSHSGWSDIFFLGMDFPEGARVVNISVNLRIHGSGGPVLPPCECYCRFIDEPVIRLSSIDLRSSKDVSTVKELFNFGNDYLSLLKAGVVASGIVPPCFETSGIPLHNILSKLLGKEGGLEIATMVNNIPKGSRLAVSTSLLSAIITRLMRFSGQIRDQTGALTDEERRIVASRAILGEWLGGSGGGWQDSGGLWPGIKVITGRLAQAGNPEFGVSRGCLLPDHTLFTRDEIAPDVEQKIFDSMVLVHGGISMDVGSILEMVTEKYLLKHGAEWLARMKGIELFDKITEALKAGDMKELGRLTTMDWEEAIKPIIPGVSNAFTEDLISKVKEEFKEDYWGFLMLGGMSGGGMAFIVNPFVNEKFKRRIKAVMLELKALYASSYPFIIDPVVYDFSFNHEGIMASLKTGKEAVIPSIGAAAENDEQITGDDDSVAESAIMEKYGFDRKSHELIRTLMIKGEVGLHKNSLPLTTAVEDVGEGEIFHYDKSAGEAGIHAGINALRRGEAAVVTFAGGMGSRWSHGAKVAKPVNPFLKVGERYRTFLEIHLAKSRMTRELYGNKFPHVFTTSYLTHEAIERYLKNFDYFGSEETIRLSEGKSIARRVYPMIRDLRFLWERQLQQKPDSETLKIKEAQNRALMEWASDRGEGRDYAENLPLLRFNPPGHWYEIPNLLKNGTLAGILKDYPDIKYILVCNIDTLGANIEPSLLGLHITNKSCMTFEVIPRFIEDKGGGLAKVDGRIQLLEGLALPREDDEFRLSYYSTLTNWFTIDSLLSFFGIDRETVLRSVKERKKLDEIEEAIRGVEKKIPTYVTVKNVKQLRGSGHEDIFPVAQFEKLWGDMTRLKEMNVSYVEVSRYRGQQLKEPSQLDMWMNDGSFEHLMKITRF
ncbi:MAG: UTP--glucose-1-phosphate uridylyltransferase [Nitrospirae bacterium]|nr:UTP--glucose-1-phosphate uridylyltransferase [Nitrospirota bacterium]